MCKDSEYHCTQLCRERILRRVRMCFRSSVCEGTPEVLKFIGEETHIHLELDASSAISMGNKIGLGKARHVAVRYLWLQQLVAEKTIKLVKVKGTQHSSDVGTMYLGKRGMLHATSMIGLMEPESLVPFGYKVENSAGVRDKPTMSQIGIASIGIASLLSGREPGGLAASCIFMIAAGSAPMRAAATTGQDSRGDHQHHYTQ
eukprot:5463598-Amphidinium_carterae.1